MTKKNSKCRVIILVHWTWIIQSQNLSKLWTVPHSVIKMYKSPPPTFFYHFLFIPGSTAHKFAHKQKAHVLLCKVGQRLLCALQCHWLATSNSVNIFWLTGKVYCLDENRVVTHKIWQTELLFLCNALFPMKYQTDI